MFSFWLCGFQGLDLPIEAAGSGCCLLSNLPGFLQGWGSPLPQHKQLCIVKLLQLTVSMTEHVPYGIPKVLLHWLQLSIFKHFGNLLPVEMIPYWLKKNCLISLNFIFLICKMRRIILPHKSVLNIRILEVVCAKETSTGCTKHILKTQSMELIINILLIMENKPET